MKPSKKDNWLDGLISRAAAADKNKPVPDFDKWRKEHPKAVQNLKSQAGRPPGTALWGNKQRNGEPMSVTFPRLGLVAGIAALFLISVSCTVCIILARENKMLRQDLRLARQEIAMHNRQRHNVEAKNNQYEAISELDMRVRDLEKHIRRGISPRMVWYSESPYYIPEQRGEL